MKSITTRIMSSTRRLGAAAKKLMGKKLRMMTNHNVHIITPHGKIFAGRKGRKS
jgi:hypothetical protein